MHASDNNSAAWRGNFSRRRIRTRAYVYETLLTTELVGLTGTREHAPARKPKRHAWPSQPKPTMARRPSVFIDVELAFHWLCSASVRQAGRILEG